MRRTRRLVSSLLTVVALLAIGCDGATDPNDDRSLGAESTFLLTDAPFDFEEVSRVDLYIATVELENRDFTLPRDTIARPERAYNLLELTDGRTVELARRVGPAFRYRLWLGIDPARTTVTLKNGVTMSAGAAPVGIRWPIFSPPVNGLRYATSRSDLWIPSTGARFIVDVNLGKSFTPMVPGDASQGFAFDGHVDVVDPRGTGTVRGVVTGGSGPIANATVDLMTLTQLPNGESRWSVVASDGTDAAGRFRVTYLLPGVYSLRATGPVTSSHDRRTLAEVRVTSDAETDVGTVQLPSITTVGGTYVVRRVGRGSFDRSAPTNVYPPPPTTPIRRTYLEADTITLDATGTGQEVRVELHTDPQTQPTTRKTTTHATFAYTRRGRVLTLSYPCPGMHCGADPVALLTGDTLTVHVRPDVEWYGWGWPRRFERVK